MKDEEKAKYNFRVSYLNGWEDDITNIRKWEKWKGWW